MDAMERARKIGRSMWECCRSFSPYTKIPEWDRLCPDAQDREAATALAAVRAAYEIDGVGELVEAISKLETAWGESWGTNGRDAMHDVFDAASRVREAMGGGA